MSEKTIAHNRSSTHIAHPRRHTNYNDQARIVERLKMRELMNLVLDQSDRRTSENAWEYQSRDFH